MTLQKYRFWHCLIHLILPFFNEKYFFDSYLNHFHFDFCVQKTKNRKETGDITKDRRKLFVEKAKNRSNEKLAR